MNCKICNNTTSILNDKQLKINYFKCLSCGFTFKPKDTYLSSNDEFKYYLKHENDIFQDGYRNMFNKFIDNSIFPFISKGKHLDYGSGPGPVLATILSSYFTTYTYDLYFCNNSIIYNNKYNLITSTEVFEHLDDPLSIFDKLYNILLKDGYIAIMTSFKMQDDNIFLDWYYRRDKTHISFFTYKSFEIISSKYNMEIVYTNNKDVIVMKKM